MSKPNVELEMDSRYEGMLASMLSDAVEAGEVEISCPRCGTEFFPSKGDMSCPSCGCEIRVEA